MSMTIDIPGALERLMSGGLSDMRRVRERELHVSVDRQMLPRLTGVLCGELECQLLLMTAEDRRAVTGEFCVHALFGHHRQGWFVHVTAIVPGSDPVLPSSAMSCYPASRFEREMRDLMGITPQGHPDPRPLARHGFWPDGYYPLRKDARAPTFRDEGQPFPFGEVEGVGVYEIPVGPVHAGVIEPGHFRFSALGETVIDVKQRLYYTHKGTEKLFEGRVPAAGVELAERISGDSAVGHALAFCEAAEALAGADVPRRAQLTRIVLLELERLYNHVGDFGAIIGDTGFAVAQAHCLRIRERFLRLNARVTGSRLLKGGVVLGGVACDITDGLGLAGEVSAALQDFVEVSDICLENSLVTDRLDRTGVLDTRTALDLGVRGHVARASGVNVDARRDYGRGQYEGLSFDVPVMTSGDVRARLLIRLAEAKQSAGLIRQAVQVLPSGPLSVQVGALPAFEAGFGIVEGWRGAIVHWMMADRAGRLHRVKVVDPSFLAWPALSRAMVGNIVPDFPLCNKSFNLSYSGNDL
ncbi:MAG: NADH-quinone oxidoreductase subunit C [Acidobacteriota bacterium]